ncbi:MAG: chromosomal replication initiator protein DnaA [bacterium]|nr:chromosomal replication initiator protein DnaA [bacterium]
MEHKEEAVISPKIGIVDGNDLHGLWQAALGEIEIQVSHPNFVTWFKNSTLIDKNENAAVVALPNAFAKEWIENKYAKIVLGSLRALEENIKKVEFTVYTGKAMPAHQAPVSHFTGHEPQPSFPEFRVDVETNLNPRYTLNSFVVGKSNELAYAAASAVVEDIGKRYNPLFIYGGVGLGKTHLIQAVGNEIYTRYQNRVRVRYVSSEKFTNDVISAIRNKNTELMKEKYRLVDVLIIDDIQFVIGKAATEEEFFHTFNALYEGNKQIIISSDKPPKFMPNLEERLRSRFEGGMIIDIGYPDYELRFAILKAKIQERAVSLTDEVVAHIANKIQRNFRELEGVLNRIIFFQKTRGIEISLRIAEEIMSEIMREPVKSINPNAIIKAVAEVFGISPTELISHSRKREVVEPRQIAMFLLREILDLSYPNIGDRMGKRDHTTAIYAYEKVLQETSKNQLLNQKIITIKELINKE